MAKCFNCGRLISKWRGTPLWVHGRPGFSGYWCDNGKTIASPYPKGTIAVYEEKEIIKGFCNG